MKLDVYRQLALCCLGFSGFIYSRVEIWMRTEIVAGFHPNAIMGRVKWHTYRYKCRRFFVIKWGRHGKSNLDGCPPPHNVRSWQRDHVNRMDTKFWFVVCDFVSLHSTLLCLCVAPRILRLCVSVIHSGFSHHNQIQVKEWESLIHARFRCTYFLVWKRE